MRVSVPIGLFRRQSHQFQRYYAAISFGTRMPAQTQTSATARPTPAPPTAGSLALALPSLRPAHRQNRPSSLSTQPSSAISGDAALANLSIGSTVILTAVRTNVFWPTRPLRRWHICWERVVVAGGTAGGH